MFLHKTNYDELTTEQMEAMLQTQVGGANLTYQTGQGIETPSYSNLPTFSNDAAAIAKGYVKGMPYLNNSGALVHVGING